MTEPLWRPTHRQIEAANMTGLMRRIERDWGVSLPDYDALWRFSIGEMAKFWTSLWDDVGVIAETRGERVIVDGEKMPGARFFPEARLNFAENLLRRRDDGDAIVFRREDGLTRRYSARALSSASRAPFPGTGGRSGSPPGGSTTNTSAPSAASHLPAKRAATFGSSSTTRSRDSGASVTCPALLHRLSGREYRRRGLALRTFSAAPSGARARISSVSFTAPGKSWSVCG